MGLDNIPAIATAVGTVIAAVGGALSYYYNGKQKAIQEQAKLEIEKNSREVRDLESSNRYLLNEVEKIREVSKQITESYSVIISRVEGLEEENKLLRDENISLRRENAELKTQLAGLEEEIEEVKKTRKTTK